MSLYIGMAYHSSSSSPVGKKQSKSSLNPEQPMEQPPKHPRLEPPPAQYNLSVIDEFTGSPNTSSVSIQSSTHSSAPSSSTTTTVIHGGGILDQLQQSTETLSEINQELMPEEEQSVSRHSSSSSQLSSSKGRKSGGHKNERLLKEYELCLEQVLVSYLSYRTSSICL